MKKPKIISFYDKDVLDIYILPEFNLSFQKGGWSICFGWIIWRYEIMFFKE